MSAIVAIARLVALLGISIVLGLVHATARLVPGTALRRRWRGACFMAWGAALCRIINLRREVQGSPPHAPFLLVSNHLGYLDIPVYASLMHVRFISKREVRKWPLFGWLASEGGAIFVDRRRHSDLARVNDHIHGALQEGRGVLLFPEGTSGSGKDVLPFRPSLLHTAIREDVPVHYACLHYRTAPGDPPAETAVAWWGGMTFSSHFRKLLTLRRIDCTVRFGAAPLRAVDRKTLAAQLHDRVAAALVLTPGGSEYGA
jgi:1-acyl-sn-glycerol-3-phosphate acyltransferase